MNNIVDEAIVLKRIEYGEADRILTVLTKNHGKISVIAKGVRKPKSKLAGGIEIFCVNSISYVNSKNELKTLASAQVAEHFSRLVTNLALSATAYDVLKFTHQYTEIVCEDEYYSICVDALRGLQLGLNADLVTVWFGVCMLQISGHGLSLQSDASGTTLQVKDTFSFYYPDMAFRVDPNGAFTSQHVKLLRLCGQVHLQNLRTVQNVQQLAADLRLIVLDALKFNSHVNLK